jgi:predicted ATPase
MLCGSHSHAVVQSQQLIALAEDKGAWFWKPYGMMQQRCAHALAGRPSEAVQMITAGITAYRSTGSNAWMPWHLSNLAWAYATLGQFDDAWRCIGEALTAIEATKERWCEAEVNRVAGEIALASPEPDTAKAQAYFKHALAVARVQQAKSWELRATMSMARLWRDQDRRHEARDLLAPVYGWFTGGFDTLDLKEAKALLDELSA